MTTEEKTLTPTSILDELKKLGVSHIVWLPDTESRFLYDAVASDPGHQAGAGVQRGGGDSHSDGANPGGAEAGVHDPEHGILRIGGCG